MPTVSAIFSGGVSVGLLAGVVSGLFYLVVAGIRWAGRMRAAKERERLRLRDLQGRRMSQPQRKALAAAAGVDGSALETRGGDGGGREVKQQSEEWLYRQVQRRLCLQPASASASASAASCLCSAEDGEGMEPETVKVREFIERLVESLVSGELDNVCIKRLHSHAEYERMFACHHGPLCEALARLSFALQMAIAYKHMAGQDTPSAAHAALKQLIHQIIQEAMALPKFKGVRPIEEDMSLEDMSSKTYEDILATAILNKVIERYQQSDRRGNMDGNSNLLSPELMSLIAAHQPKLLTSSELGNDNRYFPNDSDALSELSNTDPLSVTIEECIEEVTTFSNGEEDDGCDSDSGLPGLDAFKNRRAPFPEYGRDIIDGLPLDVTHDGEGDEDEDESEDESSLQPTDIINPVDSWEENWLFQKRRLKVGGVQQPMPVPMLVPNPSEDYRALIGDRDAEDISDLSDCSDGALEELVHANEPITVPNKVAPGSDLVAGEINLIDDRFDGGELGSKQSECKPEKRSELNSMEAPVIVLNDADRELSNNIEELAEAKNLEFLKTTPDDCLSEFGQQEGEYTEDYAAVTHRRQMDSLTETSDADSHDVPEIPSTPIPQLSPETSTVDGAVVAILDSLTPEEIVPGESTNIDHPNQDFVKPPLPGTIAEREHKKWETAPPLPNNPYSPENITKRLNKRHAFVRNNSSSDASIEFPELKGDSEERAAQPLQVVCSPSDVDYKRYGRDYYINTESTAASGTITQNSSVSSTPEEIHQTNFYSSTNKTGDSNSTAVKEINNIESKVAIWQKEINDADQYYQNMLNKKQEQPQATSTNSIDHTANLPLLRKSLSRHSDYDNDTANSTRKHVKERLQDVVKKDVSHVTMEKYTTEIETKSDHWNKKSNIGTELLDLPQNNLGSIIQSYENGIDTYSNGYSRSNSPSGSSILTSDSDYNMPSVRELTKRFSGLTNSDSSASTSKSVSPAPSSSGKERRSREKNEGKRESHCSRSSLSPPRPVREIHSLTARSISREFREELRHNHPVPLNKNVYKQYNSTNSNGSNNGIVEENSLSSNTSLSSPPKSPVPYKSMQSSIAFWEQMQNKP